MEAVLKTPQGTADVPRHVAIIMDGNGRWARAKGLPRIAGHKEGAQAARKAIEFAARSGVEYLTLFGFSSENWNRPQEEVSELMGLLRLYLSREISKLHENNIRFRVIGERDRLPGDVLDLVEKSEALTKDNSGLILNLALSYGGRAEIVRAARALAEKAVRGEIDANAIDEDMFSKMMFAPDTPDPDLLIRTSGEQRLSNFLLWQSAYTELVFLDVLWPDFSEQVFQQALTDYFGRERRFGTVGA